MGVTRTIAEKESRIALEGRLTSDPRSVAESRVRIAREQRNACPECGEPTGPGVCDMCDLGWDEAQRKVYR